MIRLLVSCLATLIPMTAAQACTPNPDPDLRPWKERVAGSSPMFIGTVVQIRGADGHSWTAPPLCKTREDTEECDAFHFGDAMVVFEVEVPISGVTDATFTVEQGHGSDCRVEFGLGQRGLLAGNLNESPSMYLNQSYDFEKRLGKR